MRSPFTSLPQREVQITRDTGERDEAGQPVTVTLPILLRPYPLGYVEKLSVAYPPPVIYVNTEARPDESKAEDYASRRALLLLAACIADPTLDARPPGMTAPRQAWHDYSEAVWNELAAAQLTPGDVQRLISEAMLVSRGVGTLGKATAGS